ncbi:hypothetical protein BJV82DRAFT_586892 [Fennellomyces sp. T-0311]|nr:hypothetical protein BJV82DRAFT_586892 [Fennellomyces sp. T-0311]
MVKALTVLAFIAAPAYVLAQDASPTALPSEIPSDFDSGIMSSIMSQYSAHSGDIPSAVNSIMSEIPTEWQGSASSLLAEATQHLPSGDSGNTESAGNKITFGIAMVASVGAVAAAGMLL